MRGPGFQGLSLGSDHLFLVIESSYPCCLDGGDGASEMLLKRGPAGGRAPGDANQQAPLQSWELVPCLQALGLTPLSGQHSMAPPTSLLKTSKGFPQRSASCLPPPGVAAPALPPLFILSVRPACLWSCHPSVCLARGFCTCGPHSREQPVTPHLYMAASFLTRRS